LSRNSSNFVNASCRFADPCPRKLSIEFNPRVPERLPSSESSSETFPARRVALADPRIESSARAGCPPYARASARRFLSRRSSRLPPRKGTKGRFGRRQEGARLCKQRSQFSRRTLRATSAPPRDPSRSRTSSSFYLLLLFASVTPLSLSFSLARHSAADNEQPLLQPAITQVPLAKAAKRLLREASRDTARASLWLSRRTVCPGLGEGTRAAVGLPRQSVASRSYS